MQISNDIKYIGVNDNKIDLFEAQFPTPNGMSYNSYIILDEKIAVLDSVEEDFGDLWISNIKGELNGKIPDYLIVHHMEPDHSSNIFRFIKEFPTAKIVSSKKAFNMMNNFFKTDFSENQIIVGEGDTLNLGRHTLTFFTAPMVHWPEVIVSYDNLDKVLFSADAFGKFGTTDTLEGWTNEARRYYFGIVAKYGLQVQSLLKKLSNLGVKTICSLHGPVLKENISKYFSLYNTWSSYMPEEDGVFIAYTSVYGHTKKAVELLAKILKESGQKNIVLCDLVRTDMSKAVENAFRYSKLVLATTTYNATIFPTMNKFINHLTERGFKNRKVAFIENGSWAPSAEKIMKRLLENSNNLTYYKNVVKIVSSVSYENIAQIKALAKELSN